MTRCSCNRAPSTLPAEPEPFTFKDAPKIDGMELRDVSGEAWREYAFFHGGVYHIDNPVALYCAPGSATHRVVDSLGITHCCLSPETGNCVLRWQSRDPAKPVQF